MHMDFYAINNFLENVPQYVSDNPRFSFGIDRARIVLDRLGHPEREMKVIHVAGTNGKGSVCAFLDSCLRKTGARVGLFTSPHLTDIRERIRLDGDLIPVDEFTEIFNYILEEVEKVKEKEPYFNLAYFEYFFLVALIYFKKAGTDFVILETGLGGLKDATNVVEKPIMSIITSLGLEHTEVLGNTLEKIAFEKAGIIKNGSLVVALKPEEKSVEEVIVKKAKEEGARLVFADKNDLRDVSINGTNIDFSIENEYYKNVSFFLSIPAFYEATNALIALTAYIYLRGNLFSKDYELLKEGLKETVWEGRMQAVLDKVFIDGAHNPQGVDELIKSARAICKGEKASLLFSVVSDKNFDLMIKKICESKVFNNFFVTKIASARSVSENLIKDTFEKYTKKPVIQFNNVNEAFKYALENKEDYLFCAGSLYLIGELEEEINKVRLSK